MPRKPVFCNKVHTHMLQVSGRLFIPIHFISVFSQFCKTIHTRFSNVLQYQSYHALQSSARPFKPRFSCLVDRFLYSAILRSRADILRSRVILHDSVACYSAFLNIHRSSVLTALTWLVPHESAAASALSVYTIEPCTMSLHAKTQSSARPFILIRSRLLQDSSYPYSPDFCKTVHTHTLQISARQFIHIHSRRLQDNSYPYNPDFCRTFHTHTLQTSARQFIPIHSRLLKEQFISIQSRLLQDSSYPYTPDLCKTVHTHTLQTSAGQFIPIHSRPLKEQFIPIHSRLLKEQFIPIHSRLLKEQFIPIHSRLLQDSSYQYTPDF